MDIDRLFDLGGKVAVVTGVGDGIGKACSEILAAAVASVIVSDINPDKAKAVADGITAGGKAAPVACNVLDDSQRVALIDAAVKTYGAVNILVNNAGLGGGGRENPFHIDLAYIERIYGINVFAPFRLCQLAVPLMKQSGYGRIVNITSMSSVDQEANMCVYASFKAALNHLAANLAYDFGPYGVTISNVGPGATKTAALMSILTLELEQKMLARTPIHRLGEVSDIARAVLFFASEAAAWVSGQVLFVNGGGAQTLD